MAIPAIPNHLQQRQQPQGQPQEQPDPAAMIKAQTDAQAAQATAAVEQEKLRIDAYKAETERMKAVHEIQQPTQLRTPAPAEFGA